MALLTSNMPLNDFKEYRLITGELGGADRTMETLRYGMSKAFFEQRKSRINSALNRPWRRRQLPILIQAVGRRPKNRYVFRWPRNRFTIK